MSTSGTPEWEVALVARLHDGDETALRELMDAYFQTVADVAFRYLRTTDDARDVAQEVFIRLWERRGALAPTGKLVHYLRRVARNSALDRLDRDAAAMRLERTLTSEYEIVRPHEENRGAMEVDMAELSQAVRRAMEELSPRVREVAGLYLEQGLEPGEIARLLGVAPRTVYNQLRTAMQRLADALGGWPR